MQRRLPSCRHPTPWTRSLVLCLLVGCVAALPGCSSVRALDEPALQVSGSEKARIEKQVEAALAAEEWVLAWNQAVDAGLSQARFEDILLRTIRADSGAAEDMLEELQTRFGELTAKTRTEVHGLAGTAAAEGDWERAAEIEILVAEDAPVYQRAWDLYGRAPPTEAPGILEQIADAREAAATEAAGTRGG